MVHITLREKLKAVLKEVKEKDYFAAEIPSDICKSSFHCL
jgi:hypothetical protein